MVANRRTPVRDWVPAAWDPGAGVVRPFGDTNQGSSPLSDTQEWSPAE